MPDLIDLISKWWKQLLLVILLSLLAVGIITFLKPRQWLAMATSVPASSFASDKSKFFSENIQALYAALGTTDDLDLILGTAQLDTVYLAITDRFNLFDHYKMGEKGNAARTKAASLLKRNTRVMKTEYGELKVKVWDTDKNLAPQLANGIMDKLQSIHQDLQSEGNKSNLAGLLAGKARIGLQIDSIKQFLSVSNMQAGVEDPYTTRLLILTDQLTKYEKLITEYELLVGTKPPVLIIVEKARAPEYPDRPKRMQILIATVLLSMLFSLLAILILERSKLSGNGQPSK